MIIQRCEEKDFQQLKLLFREIYRGNPLLQRDDYLHWQFRDNPYNGDDGITLLLLRDDTRIRGFYGWVPVELVYDGRNRKGAETFLWWADRETGIGGLELLNEMGRVSDVRLAHDCTEEAAAILRSFRLPIYVMKRWVAVLDAGAVSGLFGLEEEALLHNCINTEKEEGGSGIHTIQRFEDSDEMVFEDYPSIRKHIQYSGAYLNWRYFDIPAHEYHVISSGRKGEYGVYRIERVLGEEYSVLRIMEWSFGHESSGEAMGFLVGKARKNNAVLMDFFCSSDEIAQTLKHCGFVPGWQEPFNRITRLFRPIFPAGDIVTCIIDKENGAGTGFDEWYCTKGNSDMDRFKK